MQLIPLTFEARNLTGFSHKAIISVTDTQALANGSSQNITIFPQAVTYLAGGSTYQTQNPPQLPVGFCVRKAAALVLTPFITSVSQTLNIGDAASASRYATVSLHTAGTPVLGSAGYVYTPADVANSNAQIVANFNCGAGNVNAWTTGEVEIYLDLVDFNELLVPLEPSIKALDILGTNYGG